MSKDTKIYNTPQEAEAAFYQAFIDANLDAMMSVWHNTSYIECIHPMGERLRGVDAVRNSWASILAAAPSIYFDLEDVSHIRHQQLAIHTHTENITITGETRQRARMLATNIYEKHEQGWKLILHHTSPLVANRSTTKDSPVILH